MKIVYDPDTRITQTAGRATPIPATNSTRGTTSGSPSSGPGHGSDVNVNASSDGQPTASNSDGSTGSGVSEFSFLQPLSFMPIH